jgi:hypothetical protein
MPSRFPAFNAFPSSGLAVDVEHAIYLVALFGGLIDRGLGLVGLNL